MSRSWLGAQDSAASPFSELIVFAHEDFCNEEIEETEKVKRMLSQLSNQKGDDEALQLSSRPK